MSLWKREQRFESVPLRSTEIVTAGMPPASQLIGLGWVEKTVEDIDRYTGDTRIRTTAYQVMYDPKHTSRRYVLWHDGTLERIGQVTGEGEKVTRMGVVDRRECFHGLPPDRMKAPDDRTIPVEDW